MRMPAVVWMMVLWLTAGAWNASAQEGCTGIRVYEALPSGPDSVQEKQSREVLYFNAQHPVFGNSNIRSAQAGIGSLSGEPVIRVVLDDQGRKALARASRKQIGKRMLILYNGRLLIAPVVRSEIGKGALEISGLSGMEEAKNIASAIGKGRPLPEHAATAADAELLQRVAALDRALAAMDTAALSVLLHDQLSFGHSNGWIQDKAAVLSGFGQDQLRYGEVRQTAFTDVRRKGDMVALRRQIAVKGSYKKEAFGMKLSVLEIWILEAGKWQLWSRQSVKIQ